MSDTHHPDRPPACSICGTRAALKRLRAQEFVSACCEVDLHCEWCGHRFSPRRPWARHCREACRRASDLRARQLGRDLLTQSRA